MTTDFEKLVAREAQASADAQALADVRALDSWAACDTALAWFMFHSSPGFECSGENILSGETLFEIPRCATPDEARAKAAAWVRGLR